LPKKKGKISDEEVFVDLCDGRVSLTACHESLEDRDERECKEQTEKYCPVPVTEYVI
jgi:hypothetical protein